MNVCRHPTVIARDRKTYGFCLLKFELILFDVTSNL